MAARACVEQDRSRADDYYLAEGTGVETPYVAGADGVELTDTTRPRPWRPCSSLGPRWLAASPGIDRVPLRAGKQPLPDGKASLDPH